MWRAALAAHQAGRIRTTEICSSDYIEANSIFTVVLTKPLQSCARAYVPAALDQPHSWTSIVDVATTLVTDDRAWGQAWLTPTSPPLTVREIATRFTEVVGAPKPKLRPPSNNRRLTTTSWSRSTSWTPTPSSLEPSRD
jgi:hypothetical protein